MYHEDEATEILRDICMGDNMLADATKEGKIELTAVCGGLLTVRSEVLRAVPSVRSSSRATE